MDIEFGKWLATLGVGGSLAGFMFYFYRKDAKLFAELWQSQASLYKTTTEMLVSVIRENTVSNVQLKSAVDALHRRLDDENYSPRHPS